MKRLIRILGGLVAVAILAPLVGWGLARSSEPAFPLEGPAEDQRSAALEAVVANVGDPRDLPKEGGGVLTLTQPQLDALSAEASRRLQDVSGRVELRDDALRVRASIRSPYPAVSPYLDLTGTLYGTPDAPQVREAWVGSLPIPAPLAQRALDRVVARVHERYHRTSDLLEAVRSVEATPDALTVRYAWTTGLEETVKETGRELVVRSLGKDRLRAHLATLRRHVEALIDERGTRVPVPLAVFLQPLFATAVERVEAGAQPVPELRAATLVATFYVLRRDLRELLGPDAGTPVPPIKVVLHGRADLPKHFLVSALLTLFGDRSFADTLGLEKELDDADGGSGFSFADLAADRSGTRLMEKVTRNGDLADLLVRRLAEPLADEDVVPPVADLPEGMDEATFRRIYEAPGSREYEALVQRIDRDIDRTALQEAVGRAPSPDAEPGGAS